MSNTSNGNSGLANGTAPAQAGRTELPRLDARKRARSFKEVELGFSKEQALKEASRCLQCSSPSCIEGCPARVNIKGFIGALASGDGEKALQVIEESNYFPKICGRICQQEFQCEGSCILAKSGKAVNIGGLERFIGDNYSTSLQKRKRGNRKKAAIVGSGPSGLSAAIQLSQLGYGVTVFDSSKAVGGVIKYGVPEFRLPKKTVNSELKRIRRLGINFERKTKVGPEVSVIDLLRDYNSVFVGTGVGEARMLEMQGSQLSGIMPAINFLVAKNLHEKSMIDKGDKVLVIGAGFVGMDAARTALRCGAKSVTVAALESAKKTTIGPKELEEAKEEGIIFKYLLKAMEFQGHAIVDSVQFRKLAELDDGTVVDTEDFETIKCNKVLIAIGLRPNPDDKVKQPLVTQDGKIHVDENCMTSISGIFAAGDAVSGPKSVIAAINAGRKAALKMHEFMQANAEKK